MFNLESIDYIYEYGNMLLIRSIRMMEVQLRVCICVCMCLDVSVR